MTDASPPAETDDQPSSPPEDRKDDTTDGLLDDLAALDDLVASLGDTSESDGDGSDPTASGEGAAGKSILPDAPPDPAQNDPAPETAPADPDDDGDELRRAFEEEALDDVTSELDSLGGLLDDDGDEAPKVSLGSKGPSPKKTKPHAEAKKASAPPPAPSDADASSDPKSPRPRSWFVRASAKILVRLLTRLDAPFAGLSPAAKGVLGYVALATTLVAISTILLSLILR